MCNTINGKQTLETWLLVLILFYASFSSSLALRLSSMSAAVLYKTKNKKTTTKKTPEHWAAFPNTVEPLRNGHLKDQRKWLPL